MSEMTFGWLIQRAISWECATQALYEGLASTFAGYAVVSTFWHTMASDEARHAELLRGIRDAMSPERFAEPVGNSEKGFAQSVEALLAEARVRPIATLDDAFELAHELESSEVNTVFRLLVVDAMESAEKQALLETQFDEHAERLVNFALAYDAGSRRSITAAAVG